MAAKLAGWPPAPRHSWSVDRAAAEEWIRAYVEPVGAIETEHERPWATVLRVPLADGVAWFKAGAPMQAFEPHLTAGLFARYPDRVAEVLGYEEERRWLLLGDAGTPIGAFGNPPEAWLVALPLYAELQRGEIAHTHDHLAHHVPDLRVATLPARYEDLLQHDLPLESDEIDRLRRFAPRFAELCGELAAHDIPETVQHDDLHMANVYAQGERLRLLDWGDSSISHPFASLVVTFRFLEEVTKLLPADPWFARLRVRAHDRLGSAARPPAGGGTSRLRHDRAAARPRSDARRRGRFDVESPAVEAQLVDVLFHERRQRGAAAVSRGPERQQEIGPALRGFGLEPGDHLERIVRRRDPVVQCRHEHHRGIAEIGSNVVIRRVPGEIRTLDGIVGRAEFDGRRGPRSRTAQHVEGGHAAENGSEGLGCLHGGDGDEQPAVAVAARDQLGWRRVARRDEPTRRGDVVVEGVLPPRLDRRLVPGAAVFAAASDVGVGEYAPQLQPSGVDRRKGRLHRDVEAAVAAQTDGPAPVARHVFPVDDDHRHLRTVARLVPGLAGHIRGRVEPDVGYVVRRQAVGRVVIPVHRRWLHVRREAHPHLV